MGDTINTDEGVGGNTGWYMRTWRMAHAYAARWGREASVAKNFREAQQSIVTC